MKKTLVVSLILICVTSVFVLAVASSQPRSKITENFTVRLGERISLSVSVAAFEPNAHKITKCKILDWEGICLIDGKPVFGTDWEIPKKQLTRAILTVANVSIDLDCSCMFNPWIDRPRAEDFAVEEVEGGYFLRGSFSDGAGSYEAEWLIIQDASVRTKIARKAC